MAWTSSDPADQPPLVVLGASTGGPEALAGHRGDGVRHQLGGLGVEADVGLVEQEQRAGQPLLAGVEQLIDQIRLDADVPRQHVRQKPIRQRVLLVEQAPGWRGRSAAGTRLCAACWPSSWSGRGRRVTRCP